MSAPANCDAQSVVTWEWLNDYFRWNPYPSHLNEFIEKHRDYCKSVQLKDADPEYSLYTIDFIHKKQHREIDGKVVSSRDIRRYLYGNATLLGQGIYWQWEADNRRKWHNFDSELSEYLEQNYSNSPTSFLDLTSYPYALPYRIDFNALTQTRVETGRSRSIRRLHIPKTSVKSTTSGEHLSTTVSFENLDRCTTRETEQLKQCNSTRNYVNTGQLHSSAQHCHSSMLSTVANHATVSSNNLPQFVTSIFSRVSQSNTVLSPLNMNNACEDNRKSKVTPLQIKKEVNDTTDNNLVSSNMTFSNLTNSNTMNSYQSFSSTCNLMTVRVKEEPRSPIKSEIFDDYSNSLDTCQSLSAAVCFDVSLAGNSVNNISIDSYSQARKTRSIKKRKTPSADKSVVKAQKLGGQRRVKAPTPNPARDPTDFLHCHINQLCDMLVPGETFKIKTPSRPQVKIKALLDEFTVQCDIIDQICSICREELKNNSSYSIVPVNATVQFADCHHIFHKACLIQLYKANSHSGYLQCSECMTLYGVKCGSCPTGEMHIEILNHTLPGFTETDHSIRVAYYIRNGKQNKQHPHPQKPFTAIDFPRVAYLPCTPEGKLCLLRLVVAWKRRLTFSIGTSATSGRTDTVIWNDIHHKTDPNPGGGSYGYPDEGYLGRLSQELSAHGVNKDDIKHLSVSDFH